MSENRCSSCGAAVSGLVCEFCGSPTGVLDDLDKQKKALDEYHRHLRTHDKKTQVNYLRSGFLPDYGNLLIDAGLCCISFMDEDDLAMSRTDAAAKRLESIIMKLKLLPHEVENAKAVGMFKEKLKEYKKSGTRDTILGLVIIGLAIVLAVWYFSRSE